MRPTTITAGASGATAWSPIDYRQNSFNLSLAAIVTSGSTLTYKAEITYDDPYVLVPFYAVRTTTTATATITDHQLTAGDTILVNGAGVPFDGVYLVASVVDANNITYTVTNGGATTSSPGSRVNLTRAFDHATMTGKSAAFSAVQQSPIRAIRLNVTAYTSGKVTLTIIQGNPGGH